MIAERAVALPGGVRVGARGVALPGSSWQVVAQPDPAFSWLPFDIEKNGSVFRVAPDFDLQTYAGISVAKTYYVKTDGSDASDGLSWANAKKTLSTVLTLADVDRVCVAKGYYYRNISWSGINPSRSIKVIGDLTVGDGDGVYITSDCANQIGAWSAASNHYTATTTRTVENVYDHADLDAHNDATILTKVTSEAEVDATPGTWWQSGSTLYVRTIDDRAPDGDMAFYEQGNPCKLARDGKTLYVENLIFQGGRNACSITNASATGGTQFFAKNCAFQYAARAGSAYDLLDLQGLDMSILQGCSVSGSPDGDAINYKALNGIAPTGVEIDCTCQNVGDAGTDQGSTMHDGGIVVRVNGEYAYTRGQCIADVGAATAWLLGVYMHDSESTGTNKDGFYLGNAGAEAWLDGCTISVARYDLITESDTAIHVRNLTSGGNNSIAGTLDTY